MAGYAKLYSYIGDCLRRCYNGREHRLERRKLTAGKSKRLLRKKAGEIISGL
jgi:hypothetical protein